MIKAIGKSINLSKRTPLKKGISIVLWACLWCIGCNSKNSFNEPVLGKQAKMVSKIITAVNQHDAQSYVENFASTSQIYVDQVLKIVGKENIQINRADHFKSHPNLRSEIQYLVEIDNKVVMHDKVWLTKEDKEGQDIVEIFTFKDEKIIRVDVIQPNRLLEQ